MNEYTQRDHSDLLTARLMYRRRQYQPARDLLEAIVERTPQDAQAKELLLTVEKEMVAEARRNSEVYDDTPFFHVEGRFQQIAMLVVGLCATVAGLLLVSPIIAHMLRNGVASKYPYSYQYFLEPVYLPAHTVLLLPLVLVCLGIWFTVTAYRSWRAG
jgi:hypothetical protein